MSNNFDFLAYLITDSAPTKLFLPFLFSSSGTNAVCLLLSLGLKIFQDV